MLKKNQAKNIITHKVTRTTQSTIRGTTTKIVIIITTVTTTRTTTTSPLP